MNIIPLLFALTGIIAGIALSFIALEELKPGWKYFRIGKLSLFVILAGLMGYSFWMMHNFIGISVFAVAAIILFILNLKFYHPWLEFCNYALFIALYFYQSEQYQLLIASILFIYGLPAGTIIWNTTYETET